MRAEIAVRLDVVHRNHGDVECTVPRQNGRPVCENARLRSALQQLGFGNQSAIAVMERPT